MKAVIIPSAIPKSKKCPAAIAGIVILRLYGQYRAFPFAVEAIKGCIPNSMAAMIAAKTRLKYPDINAAMNTLVFLAGFLQSNLKI